MRKSDISILTSKFEKNLLEKKYKIKKTFITWFSNEREKKCN